MQVEVAKLDEIPAGTIEAGEGVRPGHPPLERGGDDIRDPEQLRTHEGEPREGDPGGDVVTCALHGAKFDVTSGKNVGGIRPGMPPVVAEIDVQPLKTYAVEVRGGSVFVKDDE